VSTREKVDALLAGVLPRLEEIKEEALAGIGEVREDALAKIGRYQEASEELAQVEHELAVLRSEREGLPDRAYRAGLDEEYELEDELRERYKSLRPAIETLEDRRASLKGELDRLNPDDRGHPNDVLIRHHARVAGTAAEERRALEELRDRLVKALDATVEPVAGVHDQTRAQVEAWGRSRDWEEARGRMVG
jgi:DNA repair exonuclease SbcCD ATPase subunit